MNKRLIDAFLLLLFVLSVALVMLGIHDPFARDAICKGIGFCPAWEHKLIYDLGIGGLISLVFYGLLVRLPEFERRRRIKRRLRQQYRLFKKDCIATILGVVDGTYDPDLVDELLDQNKFRDYFKQKVSNSQEKWHVFLNEIRDHNLRELIVTMEIFRAEVLYVLNTTDVPNDEPFTFLKRLSAAMYSMTHTATLEYDYSVKQLSRFLWEVLAGWDWITGYRQKDVVEEMIRSI